MDEDQVMGGDGYGWSGHGIDGGGDDDGLSGLGVMGDQAVPTLTLPGGQVIPLPELGGGGLQVPGLPPSGPSGPPGLPQAPPASASYTTGAAPTWIAGVPNAITLVGAVGLLFGAVMLLKK